MKVINQTGHIGIIWILLLLLAGCTGRNTDISASEHAHPKVLYTCPMHPEIEEEGPGNCPVCGMDLVPKSPPAEQDTAAGLQSVLDPVNKAVVADIPTIQPEYKEMPVSLSGEGYLDYDARAFNNIAARYAGRIEKLYIKYAYQTVHKGQRIFDIYSPEMVSAQEDFRFLLQNSPEEKNILESAKQRLLLLGMTSSQVRKLAAGGKVLRSLPVYSPYEGHIHDMPHRQLPDDRNLKPASSIFSNTTLAIKEGMYVEKGQNIFNVVSTHHLWAVIRIESGREGRLKKGQTVELHLADRPGKTILGRVDFIEPVLRAEDKRTTIRVYVDNMDHQLKVNSLVRAKIAAGLVPGLWLPKSAVLQLGQKAMVWLKSGAAFKAIEVKTTALAKEEIQISEGLSPEDQVAVNAHYLSDSEGFIKTEKHEN